MSSKCKPIYWPWSRHLDQTEAGKFEEHAGSYWEIFYQQHGDGFFKDRHYLDREFPEIAAGHPRILEVGCGVGNSAFPLLETNPGSFVYACDFSPTAIQCLRQHPRYREGRVEAFVADITKDRLADRMPTASVDFCTAVFVLSAMSPEKMKSAVLNIVEVLKPGGKVFVRDYAAGDMAQARFGGSSRLKCISDRFYVRGDGTRAFYFLQEELKALFSSCGFSCSYTRVFERLVENRALDVSMERRWIQAVFVRADGREPPPTETPAASSAVQHDVGTSSCIPELRKPGSGEWEDDQQLQSAEEGVGRLFEAPEALEMVEEVFEIPGAGSFEVRSLNREHKHTVAHTGLMIWSAGPRLAEHLAASSEFLNRKLVLELGCGSSPLCALAALRGAGRVVSTDGSLKALQQMAANVTLNSSKVIVERLRLWHLEWGCLEQIKELRESFPAGFDLICGADVVYVEEFVPKLFETAHQLISNSPEARLWLCHVTRRVSEDRIIAAAEHSGFALATRSSGQPAWSSEESGALRLLMFAKKP